MMEVRPTLVDRMVSAVSPERGLKRMAARASMSAISTLGAGMNSPGPLNNLTGPSGYDAGRSGSKGMRGLFRRPRSANADYIGGQRTLIGASRYAWMNMPLATAAIDRPVEFTIGTGLMAIPEVDPASVGMTPAALAPITARMRVDYDEYMHSQDPDAQQMSMGYITQELIMRGVLLSGDMLVVRVMPEDQFGRVSTTAWKLFEADWVVSPMGHVEGQRLTSGPYTGRICISGVVQGELNEPVAFGVLKRDPGGSAVRMADDVTFIPAWGANTGLPTAFLVAKFKRANMTRGVPFLAPVLDIVQKMSTLTRAEAYAAVMTAMIAVIYKSPGAQSLPEPDYQTPGEGAIVSGGMQPVDSPREYPFEEGSIFELDSDGDVDIKTPGRPNPAFDPFFMGLARQIGAGTGIPVEVLLLHFTSSYTASRAAFETLYQIMVNPSREWLAGTCEKKRYEAWLFEQVARGRYVLPGFLTDENKRAAWSRVRFRGDGKLSMDPAREAKALEIHEAHGWSTGAQITAELNGGDYDANITTRIAEHQRFVDGKLPIPNVVGGGNGTPEATVGANGDGLPPEDAGNTGDGKEGN